MIATLNSPFTSPSGLVLRCAAFRFSLKKFLLLTVALVALLPLSARASTFAVKAEKQFRAARAKFDANTNNVDAAVAFGRAAFDWAEFASNNTVREQIALEGIVACRAATAMQPQNPGGHYYLAMNLGQLARTKTLGALRLVDEMEVAFQRARELDEKFDYAGPDRNLGLLYAEAPGWPTSIGNRSKARHHLQRAVILRPEYPENRLVLLEAYLKWKEKQGARREFSALEKLLPSAKKELSGERWESSWIDWDKRWTKIQTQFAEMNRILETPRQKK